MVVPTVLITCSGSGVSLWLGADVETPAGTRNRERPGYSSVSKNLGTHQKAVVYVTRVNVISRD